MYIARFLTKYTHYLCNASWYFICFFLNYKTQKHKCWLKSQSGTSMTIFINVTQDYIPVRKLFFCKSNIITFALRKYFKPFLQACVSSSAPWTRSLSCAPSCSWCPTLQSISPASVLTWPRHPTSDLRLSFTRGTAACLVSLAQSGRHFKMMRYPPSNLHPCNHWTNMSSNKLKLWTHH